MHQAKQSNQLWTETIDPLMRGSQGSKVVPKASQYEKINFFSSYLISLIAAVILCMSLFAPITIVYAGEATLSWDANTEPDLSGYKIYYGTTSGTYSVVIDAGNVTTYTITGLTGQVTYYFAVTAYDTSGNESGYSNEVFKTIVDVTPPVIFGVTTSSITSTSAIITWTTDEVSTSQVEYGTTTSYGLSTTPDSTPVASHSITLNGLSAWTTYHFRVISQDASGNLAVSSDLTFTTLAPPDTTAPTGTISINSGASYTNSTTVTLTLSCSDSDSGCSQMRFSNDGATWNAWESYVTSKTWTLSSSNGTKTVYAQYRDADGNISSNYTDSITLDTTAPTLSGIGTSNLSSTGASISWTTGEAATTQVEYGTTTSYGSSTTLDANLVTSHSVSVSGLSSSTTYHYRVKSRDTAGNLATSGDYTFTTQPPSQPDTPAAIGDLRVRAGSSTRNTVILDWTATGADGTEGTASSYELRMSTQKIIEDEISPAAGEVNFSNATNVTGIPTPQIAGSSESFEVGQLETNGVYYFAIKARDDKGNLSAISNVINGNNVPPLPVTALRQGYTMISLPLIPTTPDVQSLLSGIVGSPVELYWWSSNGFTDMDGVFISETNVVPGYGYFLKTDKDNAVLNITGTTITEASRTIPLQAGWNMIGNPYPTEVALRNTYIKNVDTGELKSYEDAVIAGWVSNAIYNYNGSTYDFVLYTEAVLKLWQGYWVAVLQSGQFEMIIYKP